MYTWDFDWVWSYRGALLEAVGVTLALNLYVFTFGSIGGLAIGLCSSSRWRLVRACSRWFVDVVRALPVLVLLVWFFFCVPILVGGVRISAMASAVIVLSLNLAAFVAEIVRAGIESVPSHHVESARASGLSVPQTYRHVVLPLALRAMVPPLVGQYINTAKLSVLASVIAVPELLHRTTDLISQTYRPLEFYTALAVLFLLILLPPTVWARRLETKHFLARAKGNLS
ncbi:MAG: amino acid ABC transporter permease [Phycisphaerales bacterium]|nr:amino acid ABC transporter permease [Phycisphaerales bacterium]